MTLSPLGRVAGSSARSPPNLDAQMRTVRAQLGDWVTCPSAKTPEGKAKIAQLSAKLVTIKSEIKQSDGSTASATAPRPIRVAEAAGTQADSTAADGGSAGPLGTRLDTYA